MAGRKGKGLIWLLLGVAGILLGVSLAEGGLRLLPSTRRWWREIRRTRRPWWQFLHGYIYSRWPYGYIGSAIGERPALYWRRVLFAPFLLRALFPRRWATEYHGKAMPLQSAKRLVTVQESVEVEVPEHVIPFESARELVLQHPQHIALLDCPCRLSRVNPCLPLDVCLIVGEPFASFVLEHHPERTRAISAEEAVHILEEEDRRGHAHVAFFKEAMLDRFYAICNCCSCCCGAVHAQRHNTPMVISSGYLSRVDGTRCQACGTCARLCPFDAIALNGVAQVDAAACMGCGVCIQACPSGALCLQEDASKPRPLHVPSAEAS